LSFTSAGLLLALCARPTARTFALELADAVHTCSVVATRIRCTLIDFNVAQFTSEAWSTFTMESVDLVNTRLRALGVTSLQCVTLVDVVFTVCARVAETTQTPVVGAIIHARGIVTTRATTAVIDRMLTPTTKESGCALALECSNVIATCCAILTRCRSTLINVRFTMFTRPSWIAQALLLV
jgi:hypothetical protein